MKNVELLEEFSEELYDELLSAQNNYACCLNELGKYEQAIEYFKKIIKKCVEKYGQNGHNTLIAIGNMAGTLSDFEMMPAAIKTRSRAVNGFLKLHGKNNSDYIRELVNLAEDYFFYGNPQKAIKFITRAYELRRVNLGENESHTINALNLLGSYNSLRRFMAGILKEKAAPYYV